MHDPREPHLAALKRILRNIRGTLDFGFHLYSSTTISFVGYTNTDWAGYPSTRRSISVETAWLRNLLRERHSPLSAATLVYCDNVSATYLSLIQFNVNGQNILRLTYILFVTWLLLVKFEFSMCPPAITLFKDFRSSLSLRLPPARTARAY
nr:ribonuclease H-like domain-containing protein [Tanacetum cinerariifolium]